jgi:hypothetical protein
MASINNECKEKEHVWIYLYLDMILIYQILHAIYHWIWNSHI